MLNNLGITKKEWQIVLIISLFFLTLTIVPYIYGYLISPPDKVFTGERINNVPDTNSYLAWIQQGRDGKLLFKQLNSSEAQPNVFFHPVFLLIGYVARWSNLPNIFFYHLFRVIAGLVFLLVGYIFITEFFLKKNERLTAFLIFCTSSGLGWIFHSAADFTQIEATNFLNIYESLLNPIALTLAILIFLNFLRFNSNKFIQRLISSAILTNLLIIIHSYDFILVACVLGIYTVYKSYSKKTLSYLRFYFYFIMLSFPAALWQVWVLQKNSVLGIWATIQAHVPYFNGSFSYIGGAGLLGLFSVIGLGLILARKEKKYTFLIIWFVITIFLLFGPVFPRFQRKLSIGIFIPLNMLATVGFLWWIKQFDFLNNKYISKAIFLLTILLLSFTSFSAVYADVKYMNLSQRPLYMDVTDYNAMDWLKHNASDNEAIISGFFMSNLLPGYSGKTVYIGHYDQTANFAGKYELTGNMLSSEIHFKDPLQKFLKDNNIGYIVVDSEVRSWGGLDVTNRNYLTLAYENADIQIYQVK